MDSGAGSTANPQPLTLSPWRLLVRMAICMPETRGVQRSLAMGACQTAGRSYCPRHPEIVRLRRNGEVVFSGPSAKCALSELRMRMYLCVRSVEDSWIRAADMYDNGYSQKLKCPGDDRSRYSARVVRQHQVVHYPRVLRSQPQRPRSGARDSTAINNFRSRWGVTRSTVRTREDPRSQAEMEAGCECRDRRAY